MIAFAEHQRDDQDRQTVSRVTSGGSTAYLLAVAGRIVCKDASPFDAFSRPWTPPSTFDTLL